MEVEKLLSTKMLPEQSKGRVVSQPTSMWHISHAVSLVVKNDSKEEAEIELDLSDLPRNRAGALSFIVDVYAGNESIALNSVSCGAAARFAIPGEGNAVLVGIGHSLVDIPQPKPAETRTRGGKS